MIQVAIHLLRGHVLLAALGCTFRGAGGKVIVGARQPAKNKPSLPRTSKDGLEMDLCSRDMLERRAVWVIYIASLKLYGPGCENNPKLRFSNMGDRGRCGGIGSLGLF